MLRMDFKTFCRSFINVPAQVLRSASRARPRLGFHVRATAEGLVVAAVDPEGPSAAAGLRVGDRLESAGGQPLATSADLRQAMRRDQLELYYQPRIDLRTSEVVSLEALIRWNHPTRGLIRPDDFLPLCESMGLMRKLGYPFVPFIIGFVLTPMLELSFSQTYILTEAKISNLLDYPVAVALLLLTLVVIGRSILRRNTR